MVIVYPKSVDILRFVRDVKEINDLDEINWKNDDVHIIIIQGNEISIKNVSVLSNFFSWISNGGNVIWVGDPFRRVNTVSLSSAKEIRDYLIKNFVGVKDAYVGYNSEKKSFFVDLEYKFERISPGMCRPTKMATLLGITPENTDNGLPLTGNVVPYNICEESYTTSYSILIGGGQIMRPFVSLTTENKILLLGLTLRLINEKFKKSIQIESELINVLDKSVLEYSEAVSLYIMGYFSSSAVSIRKIIESIILKRYVVKICDYIIKNNVNVRKNECKKRLCIDKQYKYGLVDNFVCLVEGLVEALGKDPRYSNLSVDISLLKKIGNIGAHSDVDSIYVPPAIEALPKLISILDSLINELNNESDNPNRITNKSV